MKEVRRKELGKPYKPVVYNTPDELPLDFRSLLALFLGLCGLIMKVKVCSWLALFACLSSVANAKVGEADWKQIMCSIMFTVTGLFMNYAKKEGPV